MNKAIRRAVVCFFVSLCAVLSQGGCKKGDGPDTVPVSGKVTVDGQAVTAGQVSYIPFDRDQPTGGMSAGQIDQTGGYVIFTGGKQGAPPGRYKVTVTPSMVPTGDNKMPTAPFNSKFADSAKTPLVVNVAAGAAPGTYDLKLTK